MIERLTLDWPDGGMVDIIIDRENSEFEVYEVRFQLFVYTLSAIIMPVGEEIPVCIGNRRDIYWRFEALGYIREDVDPMMAGIWVTCDVVRYFERLFSKAFGTQDK